MIRSITLLFMIITSISCNTTGNEFSTESTPNPFSEAPYIDGIITNIIMDEQDHSIHKILVEGKPGELHAGNKIHFSITGVTNILLQK